MGPVPDLIPFKIEEVSGIEPATSALVVRHADPYTNEAVDGITLQLANSKRINKIKICNKNIDTFQQFIYLGSTTGRDVRNRTQKTRRTAS